MIKNVNQSRLPTVGATDDVAVVDNVVDLVHRVIVVIDLARFQR